MKNKNSDYLKKMPKILEKIAIFAKWVFAITLFSRDYNSLNIYGKKNNNI